MTLIGLIIIVLWLVFDESSKTAKARSKCAVMNEQGAFLPNSGLRKNMIWHDVSRDWREEKKLFPEEYRTYLSRNRDALVEYTAGLVMKQEIAEGFQPSFCIGTYNKHTFDPMAGFHARYDEKIKILNETGECYW